MDWALIESWKEMGVPLHVALRGIERSFDSYESKPRKRSVKTLFYCQEEVEAQFAEWLESQLGANGEEEVEDVAGEVEEADARLPFPRRSILEHMARARLSLVEIGKARQRKDALFDALSRTAHHLEELEKDFAHARRPDAEKLESDLTMLEKNLDDAVLDGMQAEELERLRSETEDQLKPYRNRMERATYQQTFENLLLKRLREQHKLPRLSLFYL
jgi:CHAT domain-containing protein